MARRGFGLLLIGLGIFVYPIRQRARRVSQRECRVLEGARGHAAHRSRAAIAVYRGGTAMELPLQVRPGSRRSPSAGPSRRGATDFRIARSAIGPPRRFAEADA